MYHCWTANGAPVFLCAGGGDWCPGVCPPTDTYSGRGPLDTSSRAAGTQETMGGT